MLIKGAPDQSITQIPLVIKLRMTILWVPWENICAWWRHEMGTFSALLALCAGNSPVTGEFPAQRPVTWSFDVFLDLHPNSCLSKQSWCLWFETPSRSLWRHCNGCSIKIWQIIYVSVNWVTIGSGNGFLPAKLLHEPMLTYCQLVP